MMENKLKPKLASRQTVVGTMLDEIRDPLIIPLLAKSGFDFVIVDFEHSTFSNAEFVQFVVAAKSTNLTVLARPSGSDYISLAKLWDAGALGLMVPRVESPEEVNQIIKASKYPPLGERGYGPRGVVTDYDIGLSMKEKISAINQNTTIILQIEKKRAIDAIDAMIAPQAIDGVIIGPNDLSLSLGVPGEFSSEVYIKAVEKVVAACKAKGIPAGIHTASMKDLLFWKSKGMTIMMYASPFKIIQDAAIELTKKLR